MSCSPRSANAPDFTLLELDCDHMVPGARPAETAAVIRKQLERG